MYFEINRGLSINNVENGTMSFCLMDRLLLEFWSLIELRICVYEQGSDTLLALMDHPTLVSASNSFKSKPERKLKIPQESGSGRSAGNKWVYLFQREYAAVLPTLVDVCLFLILLKLDNYKRLR